MADNYCDNDLRKEFTGLTYSECVCCVGGVSCTVANIMSYTGAGMQILGGLAVGFTSGLVAGIWSTQLKRGGDGSEDGVFCAGSCVTSLCLIPSICGAILSMVATEYLISCRD